MTVLAALRTAAALLLVSASTLLLGPPTIVIGWLFNWPNLPFQAGILTVRIALAVVGLRYDATEVMAGVTEVLCYGTAVVVARE